jgi:DNA invertase Pin-like site-specific DNA recombinase
MSEGNSIRAVAYWRMSSSQQEKSIPQQRAEMLPRCRPERGGIVREFKDEGISGGGMKRRDDLLDMVGFCQAQAQAGTPIHAVVCYDTSRFSRADSNETSLYIWELRKAGTQRLLTFERWFDSRKEEDRAIFNLPQDFANNRYLRDHSHRVLRGKADNHARGYFNGGQLPYGFDRVLLDASGSPVRRFRRGEKVGYKEKGWKVVLAPIPADDPDPDRLAEREVVRWLFHRYGNERVSLRGLAVELNRKGISGPGSTAGRKTVWEVQSVEGILRNERYCGDYTYGEGLHGLRTRLGQAPASQLGEVLHLLVARVDLYFQDPARPRGWYRFSKGVMNLRPIIEFNGEEEACFPNLKR